MNLPKKKIKVLAAAAIGSASLNRYDMEHIQSEEIKSFYSSKFDRLRGSLSYVVDNDIVSKFEVAISTFSPSDEQIDLLYHIAKAFSECNWLSPEKLNFEIIRAQEDEICIARQSNNGISNIIVDADGLITYSFIAYKGVATPDVLKFFEESNLDCEKLAYEFLSK